MPKRLTKGTDRKLAGVCSGLGNYFNLDPTFVRVLFVLAFVLAGTGLLAYIVLAIVMPSAEAPINNDRYGNPR